MMKKREHNATASWHPLFISNMAEMDQPNMGVCDRFE
jgi:hypothetical protein